MRLDLPTFDRPANAISTGPPGQVLKRDNPFHEVPALFEQRRAGSVIFGSERERIGRVRHPFVSLPAPNSRKTARTCGACSCRDGFRHPAAW